MATEITPFSELSEPAWQPSESARGSLLLGSVAVLLDAGLSSAGMAASLFEVQAGGVQVGRVLLWAAILPQLGVLWALLALATETRSRGLWKSSVGFIGVFCLGLILDLAIDEALGREVRTASAVTMGIGIAGLLVVAFGVWPKFAEPQGSASVAAEGSKNNGKGCLASAIVPILLILVKIFGRGLPRLKIGAEGWMLVGAVALGLLTLIFVLWFAWSKIQLGEKLGITAILLGAYEILVLLGTLAAIGAFIVIAGPALAAEKPDEIDRLVEVWRPYGTIAAIGAYSIWAALTAWLFLSVRKLAERDWRFQFSADGTKPWQ